MIDLIASKLPVRPETFVEPFTGGASVYLGLRARGYLDNDTYCCLGDASRELIAMYQAIRSDAKSVYKEACEYASEIRVSDDRKDYYNTVRDDWNLDVVSGRTPGPGLTLFLRWACYNGVFRISRAGRMNMPARDKLHAIPLPSLAQLEAFAAALEPADKVDLLDWDFRRYEDDEEFFIGPGCAVYLDPPYDGEKGFREYIASGFTAQDQLDLLDLAAKWAERGASVVYSNAATDNLLKWLPQRWPAAEFILHDQKEIVSCKGSDRAPRTEVLAWEVSP